MVSKRYFKLKAIMFFVKALGGTPEVPSQLYLLEVSAAKADSEAAE